MFADPFKRATESEKRDEEADAKLVSVAPGPLLLLLLLLVLTPGGVSDATDGEQIVYWLRRERRERRGGSMLSSNVEMEPGKQQKAGPLS